MSLASCSSLWVRAGTRGLCCARSEGGFLGPVFGRACPRMLHRARGFRDRQPIGNFSQCPWGGLSIAAWTANTVAPRLQVLDVLCHATPRSGRGTPSSAPLVARRRIQREGLKTMGRNHIHSFCAGLLQEDPDGSRWSFAAAGIVRP